MKEKFRPQHNETTLSLQYCKLQRKDNESPQEWVGWLCIRAAEWNYKEHDRWVKEQIINDINDKEIMQRIIKELTTQRNSEHVLMWEQRVQAQRVQKKVLDEIKNGRVFNYIHNGKRTERNNEQWPKEPSIKSLR